MQNELRELISTEGLEQALAASATRPILIFKHSLACGTSAMAFEEVTKLLDAAPLIADAYLVRIQAARDVSRAVESSLGIRHESPQVLLVNKGEVLWHGSHFKVTAASIQKVLEQHLPSVTVAG